MPSELRAFGIPNEVSKVHQRLALGSIDRYVGAVDEGGAGRGEERHQRSDFGGLADAMERYRRERQLVCTFLVDLLVTRTSLLETVPAICVDLSGIHRVDANAIPTVLLGDRRREVDVRGVGNARGHLPVARLQPVVPDHEHDGALATGPHVRD